MKSYYIYTDAASMEIEAENVEQAIIEFDECPKWVKNGEDFERWLEKVGGFGAIAEDGIEIARVDS